MHQLSGGVDYIGIQDTLLTLGSAATSANISVTITDDNVHESVKVFSASLAFNTYNERVNLASATAHVSIFDDDC